MIKFKNISYVHEKGKGINSLNLTINSGDFNFLIGPTGSGKTTLMRLIYFDLIPKSGTLKVNGFSSKNLEKKAIPLVRKSIGMVFQDYKLLHDRNVFENIALPLHVFGYPENQIKDRVDESIELVGLEGKENHFPYELSGGEQQRIAVARALMNEPKILLADEPSGNLDSENAAILHDLFFDLRDKLGLTIIIVTHNEELASRADRSLRMADGVIV